MNSSDLYNLSPVLHLMLMGVVLALGPLAWMWVRHQNASTGRRLQVLTLITLFLTFDLVLFGAFTRLTDSGLGCPDWPGCYGSASPAGAQLHIEAAQTAMPTGPVTHAKAWIEMIHRYLATGVGVLILVLTAATWWARREQQRSLKDAPHGGPLLSPWWPTATLAWVCLQGAFGALTVTMKLFPAIVTLHLLGGLVLLALLRAQSVRYRQVRDKVLPTVLSTAGRRFLMAAFALLWLQIALGGWVSTNYAVLACSEFPLCQGQWWPAMDFARGFVLWRPLGENADGTVLSFQAMTAIHVAHRLLAMFTACVLAALAWRLHASTSVQLQARWLGGLVLLQLATGLSNVVLGWPMIAAILHTGGAAALVAVLVWLLATRQKE
jgi:cytochrome c oxidase assembly protein subunit 15